MIVHAMNIELSSQCTERTENNMGKLRIALIGTGGMGRKYGVMLTDGSVSKAVLTAVVCRKDEAKMWAKNTLPSDIKVY